MYMGMSRTHAELIITVLYMPETEYDGMRVSKMYIGLVHPCLPRARLIEVPCMREEVELIVEDQIERDEAISGALPDARFALPEQKPAVQTERMCAIASDHHIRYSTLPLLSSAYPHISTFIPVCKV